MRDPTTPCAWGIFLSRMWGPRFPVKVEQIALEYSKRYADPIHKVAGADIDTFEGALMPLTNKGGWAILYNPTIASPGRINFTFAHELGHYLVHRLQNPAGFECGQTDVLGEARAAHRRLIEQQAEQFASYLLMPLDDFRAQIGRNPMSLEMLRHWADRYDVSLTAAALKWLESTSVCATVVVATNGYVLWCRRSASAKRTGIFFPQGMELPIGSVAAEGHLNTDPAGVTLAPGVWSPDRSVREMAIFADRYEMTISLLVFEDTGAMPSGWEDEEVEDTFDRFTRI